MQYLVANLAVVFNVASEEKFVRTCRMNKPIGSSLFRKLERNKVLISPLGLLVLAACSSSSSTNTGFTRDGNVIKGPLKDALAFLDYNGDGVKDADEPSVATDADGKYSLSGSAGNENVSVVVLTDDSTVDASTGAILSGVVFNSTCGCEGCFFGVDACC